MNPGRPVLLVIFGAGASFDSADGAAAYGGSVGPPAMLPLAPPLAVNLVASEFDPISEQFPASQPIIDNLRQRLAAGGGAKSLEAELAQLASDGSAERRAQMMAFRFYLQQVIAHTADRWQSAHHGFSRYLTLLDLVAVWQRESQARVDVVTFNYDVLIEAALTRVLPGWTFGYDLGNYVNRNDFRLFKLHGSTDWSRVVPYSDSALQEARVLWRRGEELLMQPGHPTLPVAMAFAAQAGSIGAKEIQPGPVVSQFRDMQPELRVPALAIPIEGKMEFECPSFHVAALAKRLPEVTHVLVVGWRAAEQHAINLLEGDGQHGGLMPGYALGIVSDSTEHAHDTRTNLGEAGGRGRQILTIDSGFRGFIKDELFQLRNFLTSTLT